MQNKNSVSALFQAKAETRNRAPLVITNSWWMRTLTDLLDRAIQLGSKAVYFLGSTRASSGPTVNGTTPTLTVILHNKPWPGEVFNASSSNLHTNGITSSNTQPKTEHHQRSLLVGSAGCGEHRCTIYRIGNGSAVHRRRRKYYLILPHSISTDQASGSIRK
jgi:hypothetical protein